MTLPDSCGVLLLELFSRFGDGTKIANKPPANPPLRALGRSKWPLSSPCRKAVTASAPARRYSRNSTSLWPSKMGMGLGEGTDDPLLLNFRQSKNFAEQNAPQNSAGTTPTGMMPR